MTLAMTDAPARSRPALLSRLQADEPRFTALGLLFALAMIPVLAAMALETRTYLDVNVWMKPAKFLASLSLYVLTLAFFARYLPQGMTARRSYRAYAVVVVFSILAEIAWIGGAAAMGVGSHFNTASPIMSALYSLMGLFAVILTSASLTYGIAIWRNRASGLPPALHLAIALGLVLTFVLTVPVAATLAQGTGHFVGEPQTGALLPLMGWSREVGDLRVPHFFATHAMHLLPLAGLIALLLPATLARRAVWAGAALYTALVAGTFAQALAGQPFLPFLG